MALSANERKAIIEGLVANCECWQDDGDTEVLNSFSDEKLAVLKIDAEKQREMITVANAAIKGYADGDKAYRINPETGEWEKGTIVATPNTNNKRKTSKTPSPKSRKPVHNEQQDDGDEDDGQGSVENQEEVTPTLRRPARPKTLEELRRSGMLSEETYATLTNAQAIETREKEKIIEQLLINVNPGERRAHHDRLIKRPLADLENDMALVPRQALPEEAKQQQARRALANRQQNQSTDDDMLVPPQVVWEKSDGDTHGAEAVGQPMTNQLSDDGFMELSEEEELQRLSPRLRSKVQNACLIEARERQQIIEELTSGITDEDQERRLVNQLNGMKLEQLRDLLLLPTGGKGQQTVSYYGNNTPAAIGNRGQSDENEDVLVPPSMDWSQAASTGKKSRAS